MNSLAVSASQVKTHLHNALEYAQSHTPKEIDKNLYNATLIATVFHDIGKFDKKIKETSTLSSRKQHPPHALLGLPVVERILHFLHVTEPFASLAVLAVATHHTSLRPNLFFSLENDIVFDVASQEIPYVQETINSLLTLFTNKKYILRLDQLKVPKAVFENAKRQVLLHLHDPLLRKRFIFIKSVLLKSNYFAKALQSSPQLEVLREKGKVQRVLNQSNTQLGLQNTNLLISIPDYKERLSATFKWIRNKFTGRLFYIVPQDIMEEVMLQKLRHEFGSKYVGTYYSNIELLANFSKPIFENDHAAYNLYKDHLLLQSIQYPINVTTVNQILLTLLNIERYTPKNYALFNSLLVFDGLQIYDTSTFFLIKYMLKYLQEYNSRICFTTSTIPEKFMSELSFLNPVVIQGEKEHKINKEGNLEIFFHQDNIFVAIEDIIKEFKKGKNILIVANTVKRSQLIYTALKEKLNKASEEKRILIVHSKFTRKDKLEKLSQIESVCTQKRKSTSKEPIILITTQTVIPSNIRVDTMYSEAAYPDQLLHRITSVKAHSRSSKKLRIHIFTPVANYPLERHLLSTTLTLLEDNAMQNIKKETDFLRLTNKFYDSIWDSIKDAEEDKFQKVWKKISYIFSLDFSASDTLTFLRMRSGVMGIPVIPKGYKAVIEEINHKITQLVSSLSSGNVSATTKLNKIINLLNRKSTYIINVPVFYYYAIERNSDGDYLINLPYSSEMGLVDKNDYLI